MVLDVFPAICRLADRQMPYSAPSPLTARCGIASTRDSPRGSRLQSAYAAARALPASRAWEIDVGIRPQGLVDHRHRCRTGGGAADTVGVACGHLGAHEELDERVRLGRMRCVGGNGERVDPADSAFPGSDVAKIHVLRAFRRTVSGERSFGSLPCAICAVAMTSLGASTIDTPHPAILDTNLGSWKSLQLSAGASGASSFSLPMS